MKITAAVAAVVALAAGAGALIQYNTAGALRTQLATTTTEAQTLRGQLSVATEDAKQAHAQLLAATTDASQAHEQLVAATADASQAHDQVAEEQEQLQSTAARLAQEVRPDLPIRISFRKALLGSGRVAMLQNVSTREIEITLDVQSPATGQHFHQAFVMDPNRIRQIGKAEGWEFATGQQVTLSNPKYRPISGTVKG